MKITDDIYVTIGFGVVLIGIMILASRWNTCQSNCPRNIGAPCIPRRCNFFTGQPKENV